MKSFMNIFPKNDWIMVYTFVETKRTYSMISNRTYYCIKYSKSRNKFKIDVDGYENKHDSAYKKAMKKISYLNRMLMISKVEDIINEKL